LGEGRVGARMGDRVLEMGKGQAEVGEGVNV
jgi:hypothetical protein